MPSPLTVHPLQWASLPLLHDIPDLDDSDAACLEAVRAVLARHGKLERFAVHLAHRHMHLAPDEVLIERPDPDGRTQHVSVGRLADEPGARPTTWLFRLDQDKPALSVAGAYCVCVPAPSPYAVGCVGHGKSSSPPGEVVRKESEINARIQRENAEHERGGPVAGHDWEEERQERERP